MGMVQLCVQCIQFRNERITSLFLYCRLHNFNAAQFMGGASAFQDVLHLQFQCIQIWAG